VTIFATPYTDEDMSALVATLLRSRGLDITTVPEQATLGNTDREQLEFAASLGRCLLTHNRVDFDLSGCISNTCRKTSNTLGLSLCLKKMLMKLRGELVF